MDTISLIWCSQTVHLPPTLLEYIKERWVWEYKSLIPGLGKQREISEFKARLVYKVTMPRYHREKTSHLYCQSQSWMPAQAWPIGEPPSPLQSWPMEALVLPWPLVWSKEIWIQGFCQATNRLLYILIGAHQGLLSVLIPPRSLKMKPSRRREAESPVKPRPSQPQLAPANLLGTPS